MRVFRWAKCCGKTQYTGSGKQTTCIKCGNPIDLTNEKYCVQYKQNGTQYIKAIGLKKEAEAFINTLHLARFNDSDIPQKEQPVLWKDAVETLKAHNLLHLKESTQKFYEWMMIPLTAAFSKKALHEIDKQDVIKYQTARNKEVSASTVNHEIKALKRIYSLYLDDEKIGVKLRTAGMNISRIKMLRSTAQRKRYLSIDEVHKLIESSNGNTRLLIQLALCTGLRFGNLIRLRYDQIRDGQLHFTAEQMKGNKDFVQPLPSALQDAVKQHRKQQGIVSPYLFTVDGLKPLEGIKRPFADAIKKSGLDGVTFHDLRRTFASLMLQSGVDLSMVSEMLNHSDVSITKKAYSFLTLENRANVIEIFSQKVMDNDSKSNPKVIQK